MKGIVLDMEGVLHVDWEPLPGADRAVAELRSRGLELAILTNTTGRTRADLAKRLAGLGLEFPSERIVTAASAAADHLRSEHDGRAVYALVERGVIGELDGVRLVEDPFSADVILLGGPDDEWTYQRLNGVFRSVMAGAHLVAMQRNRWWPTASGPSLDAGMFVAGLEFSARVSATVVGKPSPAIYERACALMGVEPGDAMMVGDDLESDLPPARQIGMRTCLLRTGKGSTFPDRADVDLDLPSLAALPAAL